MTDTEVHRELARIAAESHKANGSPDHIAAPRGSRTGRPGGVYVVPSQRY